MPWARSLRGRIRGDDIAALRSEIAGLSDLVLQLNHIVGELAHDVRSGAPEGLPLFLGYAERLRTDADTVIGASVLIDRQLERLTEQVERLGRSTDTDG